MTYEEYEKAQDLANELSEFSEGEGTEIEEACSSLIHLMGYPDYVSDEFYAALVEEVKKQLQNFKENYEWVEKEETFTRTVRYLEYKY